jgi:hypothetical protein
VVRKSLTFSSSQGRSIGSPLSISFRDVERNYIDCQSQHRKHSYHCDSDNQNRDTALSLAVAHQRSKGVQPYQDFALIVGLRNDLLHFKGNERFDQNATAEQFHKDLIRRFGKNKNLLAEDMEPGSWMHAIETKAIANWSCSTAANVVVDFVAKAPTEGAWQSHLQAIHRHFKPYASKPSH